MLVLDYSIKQPTVQILVKYCGIFEFDLHVIWTLLNMVG